MSLRIGLGGHVLGAQRKTRPVLVKLTHDQRMQLKSYLGEYILGEDGFRDNCDGNRISDARAIKLAMDNGYDGPLRALISPA